MILTQAIWLLLAVPLAASLLLWRPPGRVLLALRIAVLALVVTSACGPAVRLPSRAGTLVILADRSASMPPDSEARQREAIALVASKMPPRSTLAVVSFGRLAVVDRPPGPGGFSHFATKVDPDGSNLAGALATAVALIPPDSPGRILLLSDGRWTGRTPMNAAGRAANAGIAVDCRPMRRSQAGDLAVCRIDAPSSVTPGQSYTLTAWVRSPKRQEIAYALRRRAGVLASGSRTVPAGTSRLTFRDTAGPGGTLRYALHVSSDAADPVPENNTATFLVGVRGPRPVLCVSPTGASPLAALLRAGKMDVVERTPRDCSWSLGELSGLSAVLIENVPAQDIGTEGMGMLAAWVTQARGGVMMTGGKNAYAPGGYFRSPLERIMPVSMELRREHRKLSLAIVVALDRSGSMAMPVAAGRTKMDLANLASAQVLDMLTGNDELGVLAVDSSPHLVVPLGPVDDKAAIRNRILRIDAMGGGIFVYEALSKSAGMLARAQAGVKHIILFADAADAEEPGRYADLLAKCRKAGMTCSVIGLGTKRDVDAGLLADIAKRGGGRCFFTDRPQDLPRLFAQDTFVVARSTFLDETTPIRLTGALAAMTGRSFGAPPAVGGYNLCYLRPGAILGALTQDDYKAPLVAAWQAGAGRALCYTGQADGKHTGPIARWDSVGHFFTSLARWTAGVDSPLGDNMLVTQRVTRGTAAVQLHLDPQRKTQPFTDLPRVTVLSGRPGAEPTSRQLTMRWTAPDTLSADVPIRGSETVLASVAVGGATASLPAVCRPYSPEFTPEAGAAGLATLEEIASNTGGTQRVDLAGIWSDLPESPRRFALAGWLLLAGMVLFALEILERRTALLSLAAAGVAGGAATLVRRAAAGRPKPTAEPTAEPTARAEPEGGQPEPATTAREGTASPTAEREGVASEPAAAPTPSAPPSDDVLDALTRARRRADRRTDRT